MKLDELEKKLEVLSSEVEKLKEEKRNYIKKVGFLRFNPFDEVGGNQSFSVVLLDEKQDGVIITSLYQREQNRVYGKSIKAGKSEYPLIEEEEKLLEQMKNEKNYESRNKNNNKKEAANNHRSGAR